MYNTDETIASLRSQLKDMTDQFFAVSGQLGEARAGLKKALLLVEKAKPYVADHAAMTCDDMRGLGGDVGDAYWLDIAEQWEPKLKSLLS